MRRLGAAIAVLAFIGAAVLALEIEVDGTRLSVAVKQDFADATYYPAQAFWEDDVEPYDHVLFLDRYPGSNEFPLYAPHQLVLGAPFIALDFAAASLVFGIALLALVTYFGYLLIQLAGRRPSVVRCASIASLLLLTRPIEFAFDLGQSTILPLIGFAQLIRYGRMPGRRAACMTGLATALVLTKPQFGLPLLFATAIPGSPLRVPWTRLAGSLAATVAVNLLLSWRLIELAGGLQTLLSGLAANMDYSASAPYSRPGNPIGVRTDLLDSLARITGTRPGLSIQLALGIAGLALIWRLTKVLGDILDDSVRLLTTVAMVVSVVLAAFFHPYYDIPLAFVVVPLAVRAWPALGRSERQVWALVAGSALGVLVVLRGAVLAPLASVLDADQQRVSLEVFRSGSALLIVMLGVATFITWYREKEGRVASNRALEEDTSAMTKSAGGSAIDGSPEPHR